MSIRRVLVVEDEPELALLLRKKLTADGFLCATASDGAQAWAAAKRETPDAVILDLMLSGEHGLMLLRRFKSDPVLRQAKVIVTTAWTNEQTRLEAQRLGASAFVEKPFSLEALVGILRQLLGVAPGAAASQDPPPNAAATGGIILP